MLYTNKHHHDEDEMLYYLLANKESNVRSLTDANFEVSKCDLSQICIISFF